VNKNKIKAIIYIMIPVIAWGVSFVNTNVLMKIMDSSTLGALRFIIGVLFILFVGLLFGNINKDLKIVKIPFKNHKSFVIAGGIGITLYIYLENIGINLTSPSIASFLIATIPIVTIIGEFFVYRRRISKSDFFALFLSMLGVLFIIGENPILLFQTGQLKGYLYMFGAVISWVIYSLVTKDGFTKYNHFTILFYQTLYGALFFVPFLLFNDFSSFNLSLLLEVKNLLHLFFLIIFASILGFYYYIKAMNILGVSESNIFINFIPIITIITSYILLKESISISQIIGGILILTSVTITTIMQK
jgi:drug/metabolite transporter (DMT)-like permease